MNKLFFLFSGFLNGPGFPEKNKTFLDRSNGMYNTGTVPVSIIVPYHIFIHDDTRAFLPVAQPFFCLGWH